MLQIVLALDASGAHDRAIATAVRKQRVVPWDARVAGAVAWAHVGLGQLDAARELVTVPDDESPTTSLALAAIAAHDGEIETALAKLREGHQRRYRPWAPLLDDKRFARLRTDARFIALF